MKEMLFVYTLNSCSLYKPIIIKEFGENFN